MTGMVPYAKQPPDDLRDACERPEVARVAGRCNPRSPFASYIPDQRKTELTDAHTARATTDRLLPALSSRIACRRRPSSCAAVPGIWLSEKYADAPP